MLEKIQEKYEMKQQVYLNAKRTLFNEEKESQIFHPEPFIENFPKFLQLELKYSIYSKEFKEFPFTKYLDPLILNHLGDAMKSKFIPAGNTTQFFIFYSI
jgi:hypothetical protein